ncbi:hypothetical protein FSBG_00130 [Fusobacterium gonidiaformans 3-1-5R]|uniref:Uncharacterized protein n=1 Tax=Fusobacterium gonidiaformans 3-1-5R TaxID=469605 RepID=E5BEV2_9FUSO|nr:hypothetical protein [Fusobacterium gonidiaformans]EFS20633.1 hypothetical protein FSBG_00130 [Fusobacterium gonidiaformans 3-1-5R]
MKYTIHGYKQEKLYENGLDNDDALILRVLSDMYSSGSKKIHFKIIDQEKYMWITYEYLLEQIIVIGSKNKLIRRIDNLITKNILKKYLETSKNGVKGRFLYVCFSEKHAILTDYDDTKEQFSKNEKERSKNTKTQNDITPNEPKPISSMTKTQNDITPNEPKPISSMTKTQNDITPNEPKPISSMTKTQNEYDQNPKRVNKDSTINYSSINYSSIKKNKETTTNVVVKKEKSLYKQEDASALQAEAEALISNSAYDNKIKHLLSHWWFKEKPYFIKKKLKSNSSLKSILKLDFILNHRYFEEFIKWITEKEWQTIEARYFEVFLQNKKAEERIKNPPKSYVERKQEEEKEKNLDNLLKGAVNI